MALSEARQRHKEWILSLTDEELNREIEEFRERVRENDKKTGIDTSQAAQTLINTTLNKNIYL